MSFTDLVIALQHSSKTGGFNSAHAVTKWKREKLNC